VSDLLALAERCEAATGIDREIDKSIWVMLGKCLHSRTTYERVQGDSGHTCDDCGADSWGNLGKFGQRLHDGVPAYTASLDAAMTLLTERMRLRGFGEGKSGVWVADIAERDYGRRCIAIGSAVTPALALTAACLKARAASTPSLNAEIAGMGEG
jgi:hypothetical protein